MRWNEQEVKMADGMRSRKGRQRVAALAALGLLAGTLWLLPLQGHSARMLGAPHPAPRARITAATPTRPALTPPHPRAHSRLALQASAEPSRSVLPTPRATPRHALRPRAAAHEPAAPGPGVPVRLRIPALGLMTSIEPVGLRAGAMDVPANAWHVGWYYLGPRPGAVGNAVIDGHLDTATGPAIFLNLHNLRVGDRIYVTDRAGIERGFVVTALHSYPLADAPLARIFGPTSGRHLNLITCSGTWQAWEHLYDQRLVVFTRLLE